MNKNVLIFLGVSLAINCVFIGFEASRMHYQSTGNVPPSRPVFMPRKGPNDLKSLGYKLMPPKNKDALTLHQQEMHEALRKVKAELNKDPFDEEKFKEALQEAAQIRVAVDKDVQENMVEMISKMAPEERRRFAKQFGEKHQFFKDRSERRKREMRERAKRRHRFFPFPPSAEKEQRKEPENEPENEE